MFVSRFIAAVTWYMQDYVTARPINFISDSCRHSVQFMAAVGAGFSLSRHAKKQNFQRSVIITTECVPNFRIRSHARGQPRDFDIYNIANIKLPGHSPFGSRLLYLGYFLSIILFSETFQYQVLEPSLKGKSSFVHMYYSSREYALTYSTPFVFLHKPFLNFLPSYVPRTAV